MSLLKFFLIPILLLSSCTPAAFAQYNPKAKQITNTPAGSVSATNVQDAIDELATEKVPTSRTVNGQALSSDVSITTISGNAGTASAFDHTPTQCNAGYFPRGIDSAGNSANCQQINSASWGSITGTLSSQTDLQTALNAKQNTITTGTTAQYFKGDLSLGTFPTALSSFSNDSGYLTSSTGVSSIAKNGSTALHGAVTLSQGSNVTITQSGNDISIASATVSGANPTASAGLTAVNGSASTFMRSDGAPAIDQSITPTWTGQHIHSGSSPQIFANVSSLGSEKVSNGTFTGSASGWTVGSGYAYSSNAVSHTSNGTAVLSQNVNAIAGQFYLVNYTVSALTVGTVQVTLGGVTGISRSANGTYTDYIVATSSGSLQFTPSNTARFTLDNISVKQMTSGSVQVAGTSYFGDQMTIYASQSNGSPGTTKMLNLENAGGYTYINGSFNGVLRNAIGMDSSGGISTYSTGGNYFSFNSGTSSPSIFAYNYPNAFVHTSGYGAFNYGVNVGSTASNQSKLQVRGGTALEVKRVTANTNLDDTATNWLMDATNASACTGTPSNACSYWTNSGDCTARNSHGGCSWFAGNSCGDFNYESGMSTCSSYSGSGCSVDTSACSGYDQYSCESGDDAYGGSCAWSNSPLDCSGFGDDSNCGGHLMDGCSYTPPVSSSCSGTVTDCSGWNGDESTCNANSLFCAWDGMGTCYNTTTDCATWNSDSTNCPLAGCSYDPGASGYCSGYYDNYSCTGTYNTGNCSGTYGANCSGTPTCNGISGSTDCGNETECSYSSVLNATLPDGEQCPSRNYWIFNDSSGNQDVVVYPYSGQTVNGTSSYTLASYKNWVHLAYYKKMGECSIYDANQSGCEGQTGCSPNLPYCSYDSMENICSGDSGSVCSAHNGDPSGCGSQQYFFGCSGQYVISKDWYKFGSG